MSRIKSLEVRNALPYVSHFVITKIPTQVWQPTGEMTPQGEIHVAGYNRPGIVVEITMYMGTVKGPAKRYEFPLKAFYEDTLASLQLDLDRIVVLEAKQEKTEQETKELALLKRLVVDHKYAAKIQELNSIINNANTIWAETVMLIAQIPSFNDFWDEVVSAGLDLFPSWDEANTPTTGVPVYLKEMQIEARVPYEGAKTVDLTIGTFLSPEEELANTQHKLVFEDSATRNQREANLTALNSRKTQIEQLISETPESNTDLLNQYNGELQQVKQEIANIEALEIGLLSDLLQTKAIQTSLPTFLIAVIAALQAKYWPTLDMVLVQERVIQNLQEMMVALNVPSVTSDPGQKPNDKPVQ